LQYYRRAVLLHDIKLILQLLHDRVGAHIRIELILTGELLKHQSLLVLLELPRLLIVLGLISIGHWVINTAASTWGLHNICLWASGRVVPLWWLLLAASAPAIWLDRERNTVIDHVRLLLPRGFNEVKASLGAAYLPILLVSVPQVGQLVAYWLIWGLLSVPSYICLEVSLGSLYLVIRSLFNFRFILISLLYLLAIFEAVWSFRWFWGRLSPDHHVFRSDHLVVKVIKQSLTLILYLIHHVITDWRLLGVYQWVIQGFLIEATLAFKFPKSNADLTSN
jgi:hypothetical protein